MQNIRLMPGAEPFYFAGSKTGCLVLHGVTASPQEVRWLGEYLAVRGLTVYGPRHFGHGVTRRAIWRARWEDWYLGALDGYHLLRQQCDRVFVAGLSMGGLIALRLAAAEPVAGVIALAAPLYIDAKGQWRAHLLRRFGVVFLRNDQRTDPIDQRIRQLQRERGEPETGRVAYYEHTAAGVSALFRLQAEVDSTLPAITAPALLVYSEKDTAVPFGNLEAVRAKLTGSQAVRIKRLTQSDHIVTNDVEYQDVFEAVATFIADHQER